MADACAWNLNAFCFISRDVFLALRGVETLFRTSPPSPPPPPTGLATPPLTPIGKCRALGNIKSLAAHRRPGLPTSTPCVEQDSVEAWLREEP